MTPMDHPLKIVMIGAGNRGATYAKRLLDHPDKPEIVAVADPREAHRLALGTRCRIPENRRYRDWRDIAALPERIADAVVIATPDNAHTAPAIAFANRGYHLLLEKPMAPTLAECENIVAAVKRNHVLLGVCHVLRYTPYFQKIKAVIDSGAIGDIVTVQHLESVVYWHQAHSYVRGNWRNEAESSPMLLAKSCHDIDILSFLIGRNCLQVGSFGSLKHFNAQSRPAGGAGRCLDCKIEAQCPYSAVKIYWRDRAAKRRFGWPVDIITPDLTEHGVFEALRNGPYGRCVYACDNDVVDHQVVMLRFADGVTADFTMTAFTSLEGKRATTICGTHGQIIGDGTLIHVHRYLDDSCDTIDIQHSATVDINDGHGGGDGGIVNSFLQALRSGNPDALISGPDTTLESHRIVFAAEQARRENRLVNLSEMILPPAKHQLTPR
ncbi:MAG: Gfo/Idh/MocA family oxidoreductase [Lentisphaeria bacterium]